jgi:hypothetical protein
MACDGKFSCPGHDCPPNCPKRETAERLTALTDGKVQISWDGNDTFEEGDEDSQGHLWRGVLMNANEEEMLYLDDRQSAPLELQIVSELRRIAELTERLADDTEARIRREVAL